MVIGEINSALDILSKLGDLINIPKQKRAKFFGEEITPRFEQFEQLHAAYLESFSRYRQQIIDAASADWMRPLQADLERDNLFSGDIRSKLVRLVQALSKVNDKMYGPFAESICNYVMNARLLEPLGLALHPHEIQRWRQGFSQTIDRIAEENWQMVFDPDAAMPPLNSNEIAQALKQITRKYSFGRKVSKQDALKRSAALWALNEIVNEMQNQYDRVCVAYAELKTKLAK